MTTACIDARPGTTDIQAARDLMNEAFWEKLYALLKPFALSVVFSAGVASWRGQECDIAQDIVQETLRRCLEHLQKVVRGDAPPVYALEHFMIVVANNYCRDLQRRERRLIHPAPDSYDGDFMHEQATDSPSDIAIEHVFQEHIFEQIAHEVRHFPEKQQKALLIDQASLMHFGGEPTPLQRAFIDAGIDMQTYQQELPTSELGRTRHHASLYHAYKRLRRHIECDTIS